MRVASSTLWFSAVIACTAGAQETLPELNGAQAPQTHSELWAGFDPRAEPLDVEVLYEWEQEGVELKVIRYRIGVFKDSKAMMAAIYGYPKGGKNLPGLVQIHGGGQYADYRAPLTNAKRGYATISISWAGRINAPEYKVTPAEVSLFWENQVEHLNYRLTTDWGVLDAYHAPRRSGKGGFGGPSPSEWTLDPVDSPRNDPWFLCTLGARRALTFLEQQPEVDGSRLGVYGHSMGGRLTVLTTGSDSRVKAAVPSCGGVSARTDGASPNGDDVALKKITCPILFQSPANDFHGKINDLQTAVTEVQTEDWRVTCSPHHNHQDTPAYEAASQLWFDEHLKESFTYPRTPELVVSLKTDDGIPAAAVLVDNSKPIVSIDVFYTRHGRIDEATTSRENTQNRHWHYAPAEKKGSRWVATMPLSNTDQPLWAYANVLYRLEEPVDYAGYYYRVGSSTEINLSSLMFIATGSEIQSAGVLATVEPSRIIEAFEGQWEKEWFSYRPDEWGRSTHKIYDHRWKAPADAKMAIDVRSERANNLVIGIDTYAVEVQLEGDPEWQSIELSPGHFKNAAGDALSTWSGIRELRLSASETLRTRANGDERLRLGSVWQGAKPDFRDLRWIESKNQF